MASELETSAALEHWKLLVRMGQLWALHENQLWAKQNHKCQITNNGPVAKYKSQQWVEMGLGLKQYHKGQIIWGQL